MSNYLSMLLNYASAFVPRLRGPDSQPAARCYEDHTSERARGQPVSPPTGAGSHGDYTCYVDYKQELYSIFWSGSMQYPDMVHFPNDPQYLSEKVHLSLEIAQAWSTSTLIGYGADATIRRVDVGPFRAVKLAHPTTDARARIQHEYEMIQQMASQSLPVPKSECQPLSDAQGVFGYRLEVLNPLTLSELECRQDEVKNAINLFHEAGFCHGDLSMSNIMKDMHGDIRLIDFGFAGRTGHPIPSWIPKWVYQASPVFTTTTDLRALAELFS